MRITDLLAPRDLSRVAELGLVAREIVEGISVGRHRSPHRGSSVEFRQHRSYVPGDELKTIDWKAFAKSDRLYIREFDEETNLQCHLVVDRSGSMLYQGDRSRGVDGKPISKFRYAQTIAAALAHLMIAAQDQVGVVTFDSKIRDIVPPRSQPSHITPLLTAIARGGRHGETDLASVLASVAAQIGRRRVVMIISDAGGDLPSIARSLAMLRSQKNEVVWFQISDPDEVDFPLTGRVRFEDLEQNTASQTVDARSIADAYRARRTAFDDELQTMCHRQKIEHIFVTTDMPIGEMLARFLRSRQDPAMVGQHGLGRRESSQRDAGKRESAKRASGQRGPNR